jgi:hypothetical protein
MKIVTRLKLYAATLVVAAVAAFALYHTGPPGPDNSYLLSVTWIPEVLSVQNPVNITATADGVPMVNKRLHVSPWSETLLAADGVVVVLLASTRHPSVSMLDCIVLKNGKTVSSTGNNKIHGPGQVKCVA